MIKGTMMRIEDSHLPPLLPPGPLPPELQEGAPPVPPRLKGGPAAPPMTESDIAAKKESWAYLHSSPEKRRAEFHFHMTPEKKAFSSPPPKRLTATELAADNAATEKVLDSMQAEQRQKQHGGESDAAVTVAKDLQKELAGGTPDKQNARPPTQKKDSPQRPLRVLTGRSPGGGKPQQLEGAAPVPGVAPTAAADCAVPSSEGTAKATTATAKTEEVEPTPEEEAAEKERLLNDFTNDRKAMKILGLAQKRVKAQGGRKPPATAPDTTNATATAKKVPPADEKEAKQPQEAKAGAKPEEAPTTPEEEAAEKERLLNDFTNDRKTMKILGLAQKRVKAQGGRKPPATAPDTTNVTATAKTEAPPADEKEAKQPQEAKAGANTEEAPTTPEEEAAEKERLLNDFTNDRKAMKILGLAQKRVKAQGGRKPPATAPDTTNVTATAKTEAPPADDGEKEAKQPQEAKAGAKPETPTDIEVVSSTGTSLSPERPSDQQQQQQQHIVGNQQRLYQQLLLQQQQRVQQTGVPKEFSAAEVEELRKTLFLLRERMAQNQLSGQDLAICLLLEDVLLRRVMANTPTPTLAASPSAARTTTPSSSCSSSHPPPQAAVPAKSTSMFAVEAPASY